MRLIQYQGVSAISRLIRWQTRSKYSHSALLLDDGSVIEAWAWPYPGRVRRVATMSMQHTPRTVVDIFKFTNSLTPAENEEFERIANTFIGRPYAYKNIARFLTRDRGSDTGPVFCSEMVFLCCAKMHRDLLLRTEAWRVPPDWIPRSGTITFERSAVTK